MAREAFVTSGCQPLLPVLLPHLDSNSCFSNAKLFIASCQLTWCFMSLCLWMCRCPLCLECPSSRASLARRGHHFLPCHLCPLSKLPRLYFSHRIVIVSHLSLSLAYLCAQPWHTAGLNSYGLQLEMLSVCHRHKHQSHWDVAREWHPPKHRC